MHIMHIRSCQVLLLPVRQYLFVKRPEADLPCDAHEASHHHCSLLHTVLKGHDSNEPTMKLPFLLPGSLVVYIFLLPVVGARSKAKRDNQRIGELWLTEDVYQGSSFFESVFHFKINDLPDPPS